MSTVDTMGKDVKYVQNHLILSVKICKITQLLAFRLLTLRIDLFAGIVLILKEINVHL